jgi:tetratricopeptide (TPR) repeat protein
MGLFDRLFRRDPAQLLRTGEERLAAGDALRALHAAEDVLGAADRSVDPALLEAARSLEARAREAFMTNALDKALRARDAGFPDEAAEWLETALDHCRDEQQRQEIGILRSAMLRLVEEKNSDAPPPPPRRRSSPSGGGLGGGSSEGDGIMGGGVTEVVLADGEEPAREELDEDFDDEDAFTPFETLVETLADGVAERYRGRPEAFQRAVVALNEGEAAEALEDFEALLEGTPEDPVLLFERGRCRLSLGEYEGAAKDFEAVWETLGTDPLDRAGQLSVPLLWSFARLDLKQPEPVVERLRELATPQRGDEGLLECYATALLEAGKSEEALQYLSVVTEWFPRPTFRFLVGRGLVQLGQPQRAANVFEEVIAPACKVGCNRQALHRPSARALLGLYLQQEETLGRAEEIATLLLMEQAAGLEAEDRAALGTYFERTGNPEAAAEMRGAALETATPGAP